MNPTVTISRELAEESINTLKHIADDHHCCAVSLTEIINDLRAALDAPASSGWRPIESAPKDGSEFVVYCPSAYGLKHMASLCAWHDAAGFCVDELREPTHWQPLPPPLGDDVGTTDAITDSERLNYLEQHGEMLHLTYQRGYPTMDNSQPPKWRFWSPAEGNTSRPTAREAIDAAIKQEKP